MSEFYPLNPNIKIQRLPEETSRADGGKSQSQRRNSHNNWMTELVPLQVAQAQYESLTGKQRICMGNET